MQGRATAKSSARQGPHLPAPCAVLNGKRAAQEFCDAKTLAYGEQERIGKTALYVAPSKSGAANGFWDLSYWRDVADCVKASE